MVRVLERPAQAEDSLQLPEWGQELFRPHRFKVLYGGRGSGKSWTVAGALVALAVTRPCGLSACASISPAQAEDSLQLPEWGQELFRPHRFKVLYGGRGSGKSWTVAGALVALAVTRPLRIVCLREHQISIQESAKRVLENWIMRLGLESRFEIHREALVSDMGSRIFFQGMNKMVEESIKGLEAVDIVWVEEAHKMSDRSRILLYPTVRKEGSEIWFTFNPLHRHDPVYQDFVAHPLPGAWVRKVNYHDNPWFPNTLEEERQRCKEMEPEMYAHIWLGEPDDSGEAKVLLPYTAVEACVDAHKQLGINVESLGGKHHAGLDVSDTGPGKNSFVERFGPLIKDVKLWNSPHLDDMAMMANQFALEAGVTRLNYDAGGVGGSVRTYMNRRPSRRGYFAEGVLFGGQVAGPDREFTYGQTNREFFAYRNSQMAWSLKMRAQRTAHLLSGKEEDPVRCLFIDSGIDRLEDYLAELAQPRWDYTKADKIFIDKTPDDAPSPDRYDATVLAFAWDSVNGLRQQSAR